MCVVSQPVTPASPGLKWLVESITSLLGTLSELVISKREDYCTCIYCNDSSRVLDCLSLASPYAILAFLNTFLNTCSSSPVLG